MINDDGYIINDMEVNNYQKLTDIYKYYYINIIPFCFDVLHTDRSYINKQSHCLSLFENIYLNRYLFK